MRVANACRNLSYASWISELLHLAASANLLEVIILLVYIVHYSKNTLLMQ